MNEFAHYFILILVFSMDNAASKQPPREPVTEIPGAQTVVFRQIGDVSLRLHIFLPPNHRPSDSRPAMLIFFGGSWDHGDPTQFVRHADYFASRGMVAILPDYRTRQTGAKTPLDCVADAKAAMRWTRRHAVEWGIDPARIAAAGGSAGGYLAAATLLDALEEPGADTNVSCHPNALVLFNPVLDTAPATGFRPKKFRDRAQDASPVHRIRPGMPPAIIFHGKADTTVPCEQAERYAAGMLAAGNACRLLTYEGQTHGFYRREPFYSQVIREADRFLASLGWLQDAPL